MAAFQEDQVLFKQFLHPYLQVVPLKDGVSVIIASGFCAAVDLDACLDNLSARR
jgi:hypothetical protein